MKTIWKEIGQTPLQVLEVLRECEGIAAEVPMTYAGRLDPLAEGRLLVLIGQECKQKEKYLGLDKEYEFEVLLGVSTDTGDIMGVINKPYKLRSSASKLFDCWNVKSFVGKYKCKYPAFSSKTVRNKKTGKVKPLFLWVLEDRLDEVEIPTKEVEIYKLKLLCTSVIKQEKVLKIALAKIAKVPKVVEESKWLGADFRREKVTKSWHEWSRSLLDHSHLDHSQELQVAKFSCVCSSGTYMRTLAYDIAREFDTVGLAWSIKRTKVGIYKKLFGTFGFWLKKY